MKKYSIFAIAFVALIDAAFGQSSLSGRIGVFQTINYSKTDGVAVVTSVFPQKIIERTFTNGTNENQMTHYVALSGSVAGLSTNTIDMSSLTNSFGDVVSFSRVNFIAAQSATNNGNGMALQASVANGFSAPFNDGEGTGTGVVVAQGGTVVLHAPNAIGYPSSGAYNLDVVSLGTNTVSFDLYISGVAQ